MTKQPLDEREFELINIVGAQLGTNQRDLSRQMDIALGTINMLLRRLITKGFIRTKQLNSRKVHYILTPKGIAEKARKSVKYTIKTLQSISLIKEQIKKIILRFYEKGERVFYVLGESDLALLIEMVFREIKLHDEGKVIYVKELPDNKVEGILLICKENVEEDHPNTDNCVNLIREVAVDSELIQHNLTNGKSD
ncbi:MAG: winged helix-turn-helix transcriptional regulator [Candidatus Omnitrophica bacterium]|nr:winged helix-turn-helix transcriptional regulator [Candidatus Omnitrophota bacterium]